ncbi:UxaA family hydrolase [Ruegeria sp. HKCCD7255]|uniref:UxaA family hydrolase n=1 Tax=Ruegeria sp. HKCCD7255 TaxID=2683004 RepID=UPI001489C077|nr:UxaA family hydrolase [Ruegeria sp. HKCCD7255]
MTQTDPRLLHLSPDDNIAVLTAPVRKGEVISINGGQFTIPVDLDLGHKLAIRAIMRDEDILKYGLPIGYAQGDIAAGEHVHVHNLVSRYTAVEIME